MKATKSGMGVSTVIPQIIKFDPAQMTLGTVTIELPDEIIEELRQYDKHRESIEKREVPDGK